MDRVLYTKSTSSPPTPAASSAGASSPAIPVNMTSVDWCGLGRIQKGSSLSRTSGLPHCAAGDRSTSTVVGSTRGTSQPSCRPWDRGDLLKRLATFNSSTWFSKRNVAGPLACARKGWFSIDVDFIACEACGSQLGFPSLSSWSQHQVEAAVDSFSEQLDGGHKSLCPWKGNCCPENLAQFSTTTISALVGAYDDRCDALLQLSSLPVICAAAIAHMKLTRSNIIDRFLAQPPLFLGRDILQKLEDGSGAECSRYAVNSPYFQALQLISLCGWEPRFIPHIIDCEENSAHSERNPQSTRLNEGPSPAICDPGSSALVPRTTARLEKQAPDRNANFISESKCNLVPAVLECNLCGASYGLWKFLKVARPLSFLGSTVVETPELQQNHGASLRGGSATSGIDGWHATEAPLQEKLESREEGADIGNSDERKSPSHGQTLSLNFAIADGLSLALVGSSAVKPFQKGPTTDAQAAIRHAEGSETAGPAASYESFGPRARQHRHDDGGSTVDRPPSKMHHSNSMEGTVIDHEGDEVDGTEFGRIGICLGESSRQKRVRESSIDPQFSYAAPTGLEHDKNASVDEGDREVEGSSKTKKNRFSLMLQEYYDPKALPTHPALDSAYDPSVIAVDTSYSKLENSTESVENFPQYSDAQGTSFTYERSEKMDYEDLNVYEQAQQSVCQQVDRGRPAQPGLSTSDEGGGDLAVENDGTVLSAVAGQGLSLGISGGSVQMVASHEAEIHGADFSVYRTDSVAGDAEIVTDVTENQRQASESVRDRRFGEYVSEDIERNDAPDILADGHEVLPSFSVATKGKGTKMDSSGQAESWESERKESQGRMMDYFTQREYGVVASDPGHQSGHVKLTGDGAHSGATNEKVSCDPTPWEYGEFDPLQQHHNSCPWVNCWVASAIINRFGNAAVLCGWQLTIDALDASQMQGCPPAVTMESESAASMHKGINC